MCADSKACSDTGAEAAVEGAETAVIVQASASFCPDEIEDDGSSFHGQLLAICQGDMLQVEVRRDDGWLFGWEIGMPARAGFFPENRITWLERQLSLTDVELDS